MAKAASENRIVKYLKEVRAEIRKVTWPTREEVLRLTAIVLAVLAVSSAFLAIVDYAFSQLMRIVIQLGTGL
jgi:preprotein translocase subunit SecE